MEKDGFRVHALAKKNMIFLQLVCKKIKSTGMKFTYIDTNGYDSLPGFLILASEDEDEDEDAASPGSVLTAAAAAAAFSEGAGGGGGGWGAANSAAVIGFREDEGLVFSACCCVELLLSLLETLLLLRLLLLLAQFVLWTEEEEDRGWKKNKQYFPVNYIFWGDTIYIGITCTFSSLTSVLGSCFTSAILLDETTTGGLTVCLATTTFLGPPVEGEGEGLPGK